jgi:HK97 family phage major capsid protein
MFSPSLWEVNLKMRNDEIQDLREHRKRIHKQMLDLNSAAEKEKRDLTAEEAEQFDKMTTEFQDLEHRIARSSQLAGMKRELEEEKNKVFLPAGQKAPETLAEYRTQSGFGKKYDEPEYRQAFFHWLTSKSPGTDLEIEEFRVLSKATGGAGGNLVPTDMYNQIIRSMRFLGSIQSLATVINTDSGEALNIPSNPTHGTATWTAENAAFTASDEVFGTAQLSAYKAGRTVIVSEELLEDSAFGLDSFLAQEMGESIGALEETAYMIGDGTGKPAGLLATDATANITLVTAAVGNATSFTYDALASAVFTAGLIPYRDGSSFIVSNGAALNMYLLKDSQNRPLWNVNLAASGPDTFMGYPIYVHPDVPAPAASKISLLFGNFRRAYMIRRVDGFHLQRQSELYSNTGQVGFRGWERVDGKVVLAAAAIALKHSAT